MNHSPEDLAEVSEILRTSTYRLDNRPTAELLTMLAACALQLASRQGRDQVAADLRELADELGRRGPKAH